MSTCYNDDRLRARRGKARRAICVGAAVLAAAACGASFLYGQDPPCTPDATGPSWESSQRPWIVGHRGSGNVDAPENTVPAFQVAASAGAGIETDVRQTRDRGLVLIHDETTTRTTGVPAAVKDLTVGEIEALDASYGFHPELFGPARIPLLDQLLVAFAPKTLLLVEIKAVDGYAVASHVARANACQALVLQSFDAKSLETAARHATKPRLQLLTGDPESTALARLPTTFPLWGVAMRSDMFTPSYVAALHGRGLVAMAWVVNDVFTAERFIRGGIDGLISDDPAYLRRFAPDRVTPSGTTIAVPPQVLGSGWRLRQRNAGRPQVDGGFATFDNGPFSADTWSIIYPGIRTPEGAWRLETVIEAHRAAADATRFVGVRIGYPADDDDASSGYGAPVPGNGYHLVYRSNGAAEVVRVDNGAYTVLATASWDPFQEGEPIPLRVDVTPTSISFTRTDTARTIAAQDASKSRRGWFSVYGNGHVPGIGSSTLSY